MNILYTTTGLVNIPIETTSPHYYDICKNFEFEKKVGIAIKSKKTSS